MDYAFMRQELFSKARAAGMGVEDAQILAEGGARREEADDEGRPVYYRDVEQELEDLYASVGAAPSGIADAKAKVWVAAQEGAMQEADSSLEEGLFYCYSKSISAVVNAAKSSERSSFSPSGVRCERLLSNTATSQPSNAAG